MECLINLISVNGWLFCEYVYLKSKTIELIRQERFTFDTFVSLGEFSDHKSNFFVKLMTESRLLLLFTAMMIKS